MARALLGLCLQAARALMAELVDRGLTGALHGIAALQVRHRTDPANGSGKVKPGDLVIYTADPLRFGGELVIVSLVSDGRLLIEQVHYEIEDEHTTPIRAIVWPFEVELASVWAAA